MKKLVCTAIIVISTLFSCEDKACPDGMEDCTLKDGSKICVPAGQC
jgi:hypothetical protein